MISKLLTNFEILLLFKNFGVVKNIGFALTDKYFVILEEMNAIRLEDILEIIPDD